jgi:PAS domain S-box-containing protein
MAWYAQVYLSVVLLGGIFSAVLAAYAWRHRAVQGALALAAFLGIVAFWNCVIILRMINTDPVWDVIWLNMRYAVLAATPVAIFVFALQFSGWQAWLRPARVGLLAVIPALTQGVVWHHGAQGRVFSPATSRWYGVHTVYSYGLVGAALLLLLVEMMHASALRRRQILFLILGILLPVITVTIYTLKWLPFGHLELNAPALLGTGVCFAWTLFHYQLFDLAPIARSALFDNINDAMLVLDRQGRIIDVNLAAEQLLERPRVETLGLGADQALAWWPELAAQLRHQQHAHAELTQPRQAERVVYDLRISPLFNHRRQASGTLVMLRDISARKRAEDALQQSQAQLQAALRREQERRQLSETLREALTLVSSTLEPRRVVGLLLNELQKVVAYHFASVMLVDGDELVRLVRRNHHGDSYFAARFPISAYPLNAAALNEKRPIVVTDVEQDARWNVSRETEGVRSLLNTPLLVQDRAIGVLCIGRHDDMAYTDDDGNIVFAFAMQVAVAVENSRLAEETRAALVDLQFTLERLQRTQKRLVESEKMAALGKLIANVAHEINTPVGAIRASAANVLTALHETLRALPAINQQLPPALQPVFWDLVRRALREKEALTSAEERQRRRALRAQLEAHDLADADELADTLVDMGIYADVGPLLPVLQDDGHATLLKIAYNVAIQHHQSQNILAAVDRAAGVVFALRTYAHLDASGPKSAVCLAESLETALAGYANHLNHKIEVRRRYAELPLIHGYPDELAQVWAHLIHNAVQAMQGKGVLEIATTLSRADDEGEAALIEIIDSGPGIPVDIQPHIFEPFFTTKPDGEGSGLGLDLCRKILELHQGRLTFSSQPGRTAFQVWLPVITE